MHVLDAQELYKDFGKNFRYHRKRLGITHQALSEACGFSPSLTGKWERGTCFPGLFSLVAIADYMGISIDELVGMERRNADVR